MCNWYDSAGQINQQKIRAIMEKENCNVCITGSLRYTRKAYYANAKAISVVNELHDFQCHSHSRSEDFTFCVHRYSESHGHGRFVVVSTGNSCCAKSHKLSMGNVAQTSFLSHGRGSLGSSVYYCLIFVEKYHQNNGRQ